MAQPLTALPDGTIDAVLSLLAFQVGLALARGMPRTKAPNGFTTCFVRALIKKYLAQYNAALSRA